MSFTVQIIRQAKCLILSALIAIAGASAVNAQEIGAEHLKAAKSAMQATGATSRMDTILLEVASFTKAGLIANRPDIESQITEIVDEAAISLAPRQGSLEDEVATIYANMFSQEELTKIGEFFASEAGTKFLTATPGLFRQVDEASKVWRTGITRDLSQMVQQKLNEQGLQ